MNHDDPTIDRRLALLLDRTLQGLDPAEAAELARLTTDADHAADLTVELAAAAACLAQISATGHPALPADLASRIES